MPSVQALSVCGETDRFCDNLQLRLHLWYVRSLSCLCAR